LNSANHRGLGEYFDNVAQLAQLRSKVSLSPAAAAASSAEHNIAIRILK